MVIRRMNGDSTVFPSYLSTTDRGTAGSYSMLSNNVLREGEVRKIVWPDDDESYSGRFVEYEVAVNHRDGSGPSTTTTYKGVVSMSSFGGRADYVRHTYRSSEYVPGGWGKGSKVLVLCVSGDQQRGVIIGGVPDFKDNPPNEANNGHTLDFEFNGVQLKINDSGELTVKFRGKTQIDGSLDDSAVKEAEGTSLTIDKHGTLTVATPENTQYLKLDHENKKLELLVDKEWKATVNGKLQFDIQDSITVNSSGGGCDLGVANLVTIKSQGVHVGAANEAWVLGTSYRRQESSMNQSLLSNCATAAGQVAAIGSALTAASPLLAIPVFGGTMAAPFIATAGATMATLSATFGQMAANYGKFEGLAATYLSLKNLGD